MVKSLKPVNVLERQGEVRALAGAFDLIANELKPNRGNLGRYQVQKRARLHDIANAIAGALAEAVTP